MALRMASYLIRIWTRHLETHPSIRQLPPIIPIVVYQGHRPWTPPLELTDLITTTEWTPFSYWLDDLHRLNTADLQARPLTPAARLAFVLMCIAPGNEHLTQHLLDLQSDLLAVLRAELESLWAYALYVSNTPEAELTAFLAQLGPEAKEVAMTTADLLRAEGEARGEARGESRARIETLLDQLDIKFGHVPADIEQQVRAATTSQLETWARRFVIANTLDDIFA